VTASRVLHLFVCGAGPAARVHDLIALAQDEGWDVYCVATESAVEHFIDAESLAKLTQHPVRTTYRRTGNTPTPQPDAVIVAPATYNTINKWAAGIADNYVLTQLAELTGLGSTHRRTAVCESGAGRKRCVYTER
jgi:phosphopantothenoylcysteine synthetase/decarboxylase